MWRGGSSPRVWGTLSPPEHPPKRRRIIPTGVGNTFHETCTPPLNSDHPHGCGEHASAASASAASAGSSPRVWGTPSPPLPARPSQRIIPTGVGNTQYTRFAICVVPDHPHGCGEHGDSPRGRAYRKGSSPRVWGTHIPAPTRPDTQRIIPTGVGNTRLGSSLARAARGSSPRVWGTHAP